MKKLLILMLPLLFCCCKSEVKAKPITITSEDVQNIVSYLASDSLKGRDTGTEGIDKSASYIENQFNHLGVKPYFETYRDNFMVDSLDAFNVVGYLEGTDEKLKDKFIILGAHYDHIGYSKKVEGDSIANGANDNAAGTSAVMVMAKYFANKKNNKRSIIFALFSAEEKGLLGSKHLAKRLKEENLNLYTMVNFEMVGVPFKDRDYKAFLTGYDMSNMAKQINDYAGSNLIGKSDVAVKYQLFKRSDNYPFYLEFNVPCQTISSCDMSNFDYYHHVDDEVDKLDFNFMANLINRTIPAIEKMSNTPTQEIKLINE
ncbi:M20/M25/M40 family metallo-hydrolase [Hyunsoonleella sp. SJ7]|uniref:M20/M25/M40 family metallo-hydrolase n=1 Tax=Hyunsoonleella aquatilis TaxID=2762758 RepID=A0A923KJ07_9FLAO|nr:M20/M25/M40 family metallo-hydrolase [Hyunsoonleella aquatilis]MBC3759489.1 M20/M25/M40 family metallo-hydrolase [Hyunsoonleella aquatilis]